MRKVKLGQEIIVLHKLVREKQGIHRSWKIKMLTKPIYATVVGVRVLWNGEMEIGEDGAQFVSTEAKRAILVAPNLKEMFYTYVD